MILDVNSIIRILSDTSKQGKFEFTEQEGETSTPLRVEVAHHHHILKCPSGKVVEQWVKHTEDLDINGRVEELWVKHMVVQTTNGLQVLKEVKQTKLKKVNIYNKK